MALASSSLDTEDQGGYDYQFVDTPPDDLMCLICTCVARDPQQLVCCGRVFCRECLSRHRRRLPNCPHCRSVSSNGFNDTKSDRHIKELKVKCNNLGRGCKWTGELRLVEEHHSTCDFGLIQCPNHCMEDGKEDTLLRNKLSDHLENKCPRRQYECPHCKETGEYLERTTGHLEECPQVETTCPNIPCRARLLNCQLVEHRLTCQYERVACKYAEIGCKEFLFRKDVSTHESDLQMHLFVSMATIRTLKSVSMSTIQTLRDKVDSAEKRYCTPVHIKFSDFSEHKTNNSKFYSKPFYTHPGGYRMCISVYANGNGSGKDTHVSVFVCLMKGQNDHDLSWPYLGIVTISLLNQLGDRRHCLKSVTFDSENAHGSGSRVLGCRERGTAMGSPVFIPHTVLELNAARNCQYLKDDCLYFKVDTTLERKWLLCS